MDQAKHNPNPEPGSLVQAANDIQLSDPENSAHSIQDELPQIKREAALSNRNISQRAIDWVAANVEIADLAKHLDHPIARRTLEIAIRDAEARDALDGSNLDVTTAPVKLDSDTAEEIHEIGVIVRELRELQQAKSAAGDPSVPAKPELDRAQHPPAIAAANAPPASKGVSFKPSKRPSRKPNPRKEYCRSLKEQDPELPQILLAEKMEAAAKTDPSLSVTRQWADIQRKLGQTVATWPNALRHQNTMSMLKNFFSRAC